MQREVLALLLLAAKLALLLAGLLAPGAALMRALAVPRTLSASFAGSVVLLYSAVLALDALSIRISAGSLSISLGLAFVICATAARFRPPLLRPETEHADWLVIFRQMGAWTPLFALVWLALLWRAVHEPLAGPDIEFRWSFLAEQLLTRGSLDFYPPDAPADFFSYFWAESIPPGVASVHAWAYACAGNYDPVWTIPVVVLQLWALHDVLWHSAARIGGIRAARLACVAAASCPLLIWSFLLGQETGFTTLSLVGLIGALLGWHHTRVAGWTALAGVFAVLGAAGREYGLIFPLLAGIGLLGSEPTRHAWGAFIIPVLLAAVWPVRTFLATGNPFYSLRVAGLPINERFVAWIEHDADAFGAVLQNADGWMQVGRYLIQFAPTALVGFVVLVPALMRRNAWRRHAAALLAASGIIFALWAMSVRYTNGGLFYSIRVASPALGVGVLVTGVALAAIAMPRPRLYRRATLALGLLVLGTLPATLALPQNPWRTPMRDWPSFAPHGHAPVGDGDETVAIVRRTGEPGIVVADAPGFQRRFAAVGIPVIPLWSPDADWLFDSAVSPAEAAKRWRASGVRHVVVTKWQRNFDFFNTHSRWGRPPFQVQMIGETTHTAVFAIKALE